LINLHLHKSFKMIQIEVSHADDAYAFEAKDSTGHTTRMDAGEEIGGHNSGLRPMQSLLMALGGCSGIDIVSILKKQKELVKDFKMIITGEREKDKEPALWKYIHIKFQFIGSIDKERAKKACALSMDKYCSVAATLRAAGCTIEWETEIINL
jgi:putative redox protein